MLHCTLVLARGLGHTCQTSRDCGTEMSTVCDKHSQNRTPERDNFDFLGISSLQKREGPLLRKTMLHHLLACPGRRQQHAVGPCPGRKSQRYAPQHAAGLCPGRNLEDLDDFRHCLRKGRVSDLLFNLLLDLQSLALPPTALPSAAPRHRRSVPRYAPRWVAL